MDRIILGLKSRTVWTIVAMVIINGVGSVQDMLPAHSLPIINLILGIMATYFRVTPRV